MQKKPAYFRDTVPLKEREKESAQLLEAHPRKIPIIIERHHGSKLKAFDKIKLLIPKGYKVYQFTHLLRNKISLNQHEALYLFVEWMTILRSDHNFLEAYTRYKDHDGFLYITYCEYDPFGSDDDEKKL